MNSSYPQFSPPAAAVLVALVRDVLDQFGEEIEDVEDLEVAARAGSEVLGCALGEPATLGLFRPVDDRAFVGYASYPGQTQRTADHVRRHSHGLI